MSTATQGYAAARRYTVPRSLDDLRGPDSGQISLPARLDWGPSRTYDLGDDRDVAIMYERVIRESQRVSDVHDYLRGATLRRLWPQLVLPPQARRAWEDRFPELRSQAAA